RDLTVTGVQTCALPIYPKIMKNKFTRTSTLILACSLLLGACKKNHDKDNTPTQKTKTELISTGSWKFSTATVGGNNVSTFLQGRSEERRVGKECRYRVW